ncbi:MAG: YhcH/YjgK/YiaL family protein [Clostridia bacterium]|nr:YhcH/YjgK/YiaL family protein [Clostridia bacterium]MBT7122282.1 YhcH/YjgK/YiaL family protein [Clostridia bacterium]
MIVDKIENAALYYSMSEGIELALKFLEKEAKSLEARVQIDGDDVFAFPAAYTSKTREDSVWEAHRNYIDVQYIVDGNECIGYEFIDNLNVTQKYDSETDSMLLEGDGTMVKCGAGTFMILFPHDAHMPGVQDNGPCEMSKVIAKVKV